MGQNSNNDFEVLILLYVVWPAIAIPLALAMSAYETSEKEREIKQSMIEDTTAIASVGVITNYYGKVRATNQFGVGIDGYVAFDKSDDCKIDLIKEYGIEIAYAGRAGSYLRHYTKRYPWGDKQFETLREKYFSQCAHLPPPKRIKGLK